MNLDEAIKCYEEKAKEIRWQALKEKMDIDGVAECETCAEEYEQLAEWLTELKNMKDCIKTECFKCAKDKATIDNALSVDVIDKEKYDCLQESYRMLAEAYEYEVTKEETPQSKWTPISEGLPEEKLFNPSGSDFGFDFDEVLCTTIWGDVRAYKFGKPEGHDKPHFWLGGGIMDEYVIAWQYKPEPYKKEGAK